MKTDSFFYRLFKHFPQVFFELLGLPVSLAQIYRFDSVEIKKSHRIDGLFMPRDASQPLYCVEVQFKKLSTFYANLFAKVFSYLEENDPQQEWIAVAFFASRSMEPDGLAPYEDLLQSRRVRRIYLDEYPMPADPPLGLSIVQLLWSTFDQCKQRVPRIVEKAKSEFADREIGGKVIELVEELLIRRFSEQAPEEVLKMFDLIELNKTRFWREAHKEGREVGREEGREVGREEGREVGREEGREEGMTLAKKEMIGKLMAKGMPIKEIAELLNLTVREVRRLAKGAAK